MRIERAEKGDLQGILALQKLCYRSEAELIGDYTIEPLTQTIEDIEREFETKTILVLKRDGSAIASVRADESGGTCRIGKLVVHPGYQNLGIGTKMLEAVQAAFPDADRYELFTGWKSEKNLSLYRRNGFVDFAEKKVSDALTLLYLEKRNPLKTVRPARAPADMGNGITPAAFGRATASPISLPYDFSGVSSHEEYREIWKMLPMLELKMVEKNEECRHCLGDAFAYESPYAKPAGVCPSLLHVLDLFVWRATLGFPSWNPEDRLAYRIHCPDPKGTVWELKRKETGTRSVPGVRRVRPDENLERFAGLIRVSFATVARERGLTRENNPSHPSFLGVEKLRELAAGETEFYCIERGDEPVGFVALEKSGTERGVFYIEKLAVRPDVRHLGYGKTLMEAAENRAREQGGTAVSVALINEQEILKNWYAGLGYGETGLKKFPHLPFSVCFMRKTLPA